MDLEGGDHCLICCSEVLPAPSNLSPFPSPSCSLLDKHLEVIFLLRKVLEVPVCQLAKHLEGCPSVEGWIRVCNSCAEAVKQCKLIYQELLEANRKWSKCKQEIVGVIKGREVVKEVDIAQSTRLFVKTHEYEDWRDHFLAGDLMATEQLQKLSSSVAKKERFDMDDLWTTCSSPEDDNHWMSNDDESNPEEETDFKCDPHVSKKEKGGKCKLPKQSKPEVAGKSVTLVKSKSTKRKTSSSAQPVGCHVCGRTVSNPNALKYHLYSKHAIGTPKHQCDICFKVFPVRTELRSHMTVCVPSGDSTPKKLQTDEYFMPPGNHFRVKCPVPGCSQNWPIVSAYRNHLQTQHTPEERASVDKYPKILECLTCGKLVRDKKDAKTHRFTHDETLKKESEVVCEVCGITVLGQVRLLEHQKLSLRCRLLQGQTESEATLVCDLCGKRFANRKVLQRHVKGVHLKIYSLHCEHCGKGFKDKGDLKVHLARFHGKVEDKKLELKCPVEGCGKIFYNKTNWRDHQLGFHKQGEPGYKCDECGKAFYIYKGLSQHVNVVHRGRRYQPKTKREEEMPSEDSLVNQQ